MTIAGLSAVIEYPAQWNDISTTPGFSSVTTYQFDAANEAWGYVLQAPATGSITGAGFRTGTVTTGATIDVRLETVDASGFPSNTLWATNTNNASVVINSTDDNVWFNTTFTAAASVTIGNFIALVFKNPASSPGNMQFSGFADAEVYCFPYACQLTASWAKVTAVEVPCLTLNYGGTYYSIPATLPITAINTHTYNNGSTPDVYANKITLPFRARCCGFWAHIDLDGDCVVKLYDANSTVLASVTIDKDHRQATAGDGSWFYFSSKVTLEPNTVYYLGFEPSSATSMSIYSVDVNTAAILDACGADRNMHYATAKDPTNSGSWTATTTRRLSAGLLLDGFEDGLIAYRPDMVVNL